MAIHIDEKDLKSGLVSLVLALVDVIRDALETQALRRLDSGSLTEEECERLGKALMELDIALKEVKEDLGVTEAVQSVRDGLDRIVDEVVTGLVNPKALEQAASRGSAEHTADRVADGRERVQMARLSGLAGR